LGGQILSDHWRRVGEFLFNKQGKKRKKERKEKRRNVS